MEKETPAAEGEKRGADWYSKCYAAATSRLKSASDEEREKFQAEIGAILADLEAKRGSYYELWQTSREHCLQDFNRIYRWLGVDFEHIFYESELTEEAQNIVDEYLEKVC